VPVGVNDTGVILAYQVPSRPTTVICYFEQAGGCICGDPQPAQLALSFPTSFIDVIVRMALNTFFN
jgi:hypothetical protein